MGTGKVVTVIGTRPQYIKVKPVYDFLRSRTNHVLVDTFQHYSDCMSKVFIDEFNLNVDHNLRVNNSDPVSFMAQCMDALVQVYKQEAPDYVMVVGDTNSTVAAAMSANKMGITVAHLESGLRCGDTSRPEEVNRLVTDNLSHIHFVSRKEDEPNVSNPCFVGDMEYALLNSMGLKFSDDSYVVMTIHRQENINIDSLKKIAEMCNEIGMPIVFPVHHRTRRALEQFDISLPNNVSQIAPLSYSQMAHLLCNCRAIISDSGGVIKTCPFFGKRCLIPCATTEWTDVVRSGYAKLGYDISWLLGDKLQRSSDFYYEPMGCQRLWEKLCNS